MAAQNDAPDDLIAELARLMADDARSDGKPTVQPQPTPVRIPGGDRAPAGVMPTARADATSGVGNPGPMPTSPVRVPGGDPVVTSTSQAPRKAPEPFDLGFNTQSRPVGPSMPVASTPIVTEPVPAKAVETPVVTAEPQVQPELDKDSLADLIAAELANEMGTPAEPLPPANGPARGEDNFGVPPVFGFGSPQPVPPSAAAVTIVEPEVAPVTEPVKTEPVMITPRVEPKAEPSGPDDPLREIERLVEPALNRAPAAPAPSPSLRSLATPTLPPKEERRAEPRSRPSGNTSSIDDAILAAAAATGARVEWVNPEADFAEDEARPAPAERRRRPVFGMSRAMAGPLVAVALLAIAGGGLYWMLGQGAAPTGPAPLIVADTAAVKEVPEPVETTSTQSVVFNEISGNNTGADEQIVSRDQADEEVVIEAASVAQTTSTDSNVIDGATSGTVDPNSDGLVNRKVRTVTVRPDGTIVSGEDSLAGASILPVDRPNVPDVPGADFSTPDLIANGTASTAGDTTQTAALPNIPDAATTTTTTPVTATPIQPGSVVPVVDSTGNPIAGRTTATPLQRPADLPSAAALSAASTTEAPAPAPGAVTETTASVPTQANPVAAAPAGAYVQLSSQRTEEAARESAQSIATRYGVLFGGANIEVQRVDLGERGIYYRVLVPAADRSGADNICTNVKAAGGDCLIL